MIMIDKRTITRTGSGTYDIRFYDGEKLAGGSEPQLPRGEAVMFLRTECRLSADDAAFEVYSADQAYPRPREFWV